MDNYDSSNIRKDTINERDEMASGLGSPTDLSNAKTYGSSEGQESWRGKSFQDASPDEVREMVKDRVAKGIAAVTGALEGFVERSRRGELAQKSRQAIETAGETSREVISSTSEQFDRTVSKANEKLDSSKRNVRDSGIIDNAKEAMHKVSDTARQVGRSAKEEARKTRDELKGSSSGGSSSLGGSEMTSAYNQQTKTGADLSGIPDIRNTPLGTQKDIKDAEK